MSIPYYDDPDIPIWFPDKFNNSGELSSLNISFGLVTNIWTRAPLLEIAWKGILVFVICFVGLIGNFLVIFLVLRQPKIRQQPVNIYIVNLAIADFMTILFSPIMALIANIYQNYELGPVMCKLEILIKMMCILASIFSIIAISFQRFLNIKHPSRGQNDKSRHPRTLILIIIIWIISILLAMPLAVWRTYQERQWKDYLEKWCTDYPADYAIKYWIILISPMIYIPLIVMVVMYWLMIVKINRFIQKLQVTTGLGSKDTSYNSTNSSFKEELRVIQEKHRKKMQAQRKKQLSVKTEPTDSMGHSYKSYFVEDDLPSYNPRSRSSSISATFSSSSMPRANPYFHALPTPTYIEHSFELKNLQNQHISPPLPLTLPPFEHSSPKQQSRQTSTHQLKYDQSSVNGSGHSNGVINRDGVSHLHQQLANRQAMSANMHKREIMFTIIIFCLITFFLWLPLQVLVYYRALKPKQASMACWYEKTKFIAQMLCSINSAINPFITFRRTFSQMYQQFRVKQKQRQLRERLKRNHLKLSAPQTKHRRPKPSLVESFNMTPIVQVIEVIQAHERSRENKRGQENGTNSERSPRRRKCAENLEIIQNGSDTNSRTSQSNGHVKGHPNGTLPSVTPIHSSTSDTFDPVAQYMAENNSELETPSPDAVPVPIQIFATKALDPETENNSQNGNQNFNNSRNENLLSTTSIYTHNLTKKMLMKYTPERFADE